MAENPIIVKGINKSFKDLQVLKGINLSVEEGTIFGLLGPNGAGKTTLVRILSTLLAPNSGQAIVGGYDVMKEPEKVRASIGLAGQFAAVDDFLTGRETLRMVGSLYHLPKKEIAKRADVLLERLSLTDAADRPAKNYSGGMRKRLDLGASLIGEPKIIFLDEPTTGLDPRTRLELWDIIKDLVKNGTTILLTTQYLEEADALASSIAVIDHGGVVAQGTASELKNSLGRDVVEVAVPERFKEKTLDILTKIGGKSTIDDISGNISIPAKQGAKTLLVVARELEAGKVTVDEIALHRPSLDDVFLTVTGKKSTSK